MSYELTHNTTRRAPKLSSPAIAKAYRKLPKEGDRMSGICDTCKRDECYMQHDGDDSCPLYMKGKPSNYKKLFGTPERAARTLEKGKTLCEWCDKQTCSTSGGECRIFDYNALLEWMRGDAESRRKTCATCGAYYAPYCYGIELMDGSDRELEVPYTTEPDSWCSYWQREPKTEWNGRPCGRRRVQ